eukprot:15331605-Alexandrium_andersonii.AAC.1
MQSSQFHVTGQSLQSPDTPDETNGTGLAHPCRWPREATVKLGVTSAPGPALAMRCAPWREGAQHKVRSVGDSPLPPLRRAL